MDPYTKKTHIVLLSILIVCISAYLFEFLINKILHFTQRSQFGKVTNKGNVTKIPKNDNKQDGKKGEVGNMELGFLRGAGQFVTVSE